MLVIVWIASVLLLWYFFCGTVFVGGRADGLQFPSKNYKSWCLLNTNWTCSCKTAKKTSSTSISIVINMLFNILGDNGVAHTRVDTVPTIVHATTD